MRVWRCAERPRTIAQPRDSPKFRPASTRSDSNTLDQATVVRTPDFSPVNRAVSPCPTPSWRMFVRMPATMLIGQMVKTSSVGTKCSRCEAIATVEGWGVILLMQDTVSLDVSSNHWAYRSKCATCGYRRYQKPLTSGVVTSPNGMFLA